MHVFQKAGRNGSNTTQTRWTAGGTEIAVQNEIVTDTFSSP